MLRLLWTPDLQLRCEVDERQATSVVRSPMFVRSELERVSRVWSCPATPDPTLDVTAPRAEFYPSAIKDPPMAILCPRSGHTPHCGLG